MWLFPGEHEMFFCESSNQYHINKVLPFMISDMETISVAILSVLAPFILEQCGGMCLAGWLNRPLLLIEQL